MSHPPYQQYPPHHPHQGQPHIEVHEHDILCGRGVNIASHPGNERFRALVQTRHDENYCTAYTTSEKRAVAEQILKHIKNLNPPGRFLKRVGRAPTSRGLQGPWEELSDKECIKKTCQALRDCNRTDRSGYAAAVKMPDDVRLHAESRSMTGLSNKEQAAAAAAAKVRMEGGSSGGMPRHPPQPSHANHAALRPVGPPPGSLPMPPYHPGMRGAVPVPMHPGMPPPPPIGAGPVSIRPDMNSTSSHGYVPPPGAMPLPPPPPPPAHHHLHPPPPHMMHPMHHHHPHAAHHQMHSPPGEHNSSGHTPPPPQPQHAAPPRMHESSSTGTLQSTDHSAHHATPHGGEQYRRSSQSSEASSKRSRSAFEEDDPVLTSVENATAEWIKKQKSIDTRAPAQNTVNTITPTDPVGQGFHTDGMLSYDIGGPAGTPSHGQHSAVGTTPTSEDASSRASRPSLSPASAMPPSPSMAYIPHPAAVNPAMYGHHPHHPGAYYVPPTPTGADHPYAFHYPDPNSGHPSDAKHSYAYNGSAAFVHLDQQQLQAAAEAAAAAFPTSETHNGDDYANSSPGSYNNEDSLLM